MPQSHPWGWALPERWTQTTLYLTGPETRRLFRYSTYCKFNKLCKKDVSTDWKFTEVYALCLFFFPIVPPSFFSPFHCLVMCICSHSEHPGGAWTDAIFFPQLLEGSVHLPTVIFTVTYTVPPQPKGGGSAQCLLLTSRCRLIQTACKGLPAAYKLKVITAPWPSVPQFQFLKCIGIKSVTYHLQNKIQVFFFLNSRNVNFYYYLFVHLFIFI